MFFCVLLDENNTKSHDFTTFGKLKEGATIVVPWEIYQKRKMHTLKRKLALTDYKSHIEPTKFTNRLQKVRHRLQKITLRLQSVLIDYKKSDIYYKVY